MPGDDTLLPPPDTMMAAFAEAIYRVHDGTDTLRLHIGVPNADLAALLKRHGVTHGGLVTGENPFGQKQSPETNHAANTALATAIDRLGLARLPSDGGDEAGSWNEPGFLVLGGEDEPVAGLAQAFRQAAWVRIDSDGTPQLAACRYPPAGGGPGPCWPPGLHDD